MAKKMKRIAFNLELAKAINSGEKEGRIRTLELAIIHFTKFRY